MVPERPDLDQIRRQAKELRDAVRAGEPDAVARLAEFGLPGTTLSDAQLVIAREHGFPSWPALKAAVDARLADVAQRVDTFLRSSVRGQLRTAVSILVEDPAIATYDIRTALVLGDVDRVRAELARDPGFVHRRDDEWGWPALLAVCNSRWHRDPKRGEGLAEIARLLLDAGADPNTTIGTPGERGYCTALFGSAGCANNVAITRLLLDRGAVPDDSTLYLAAFDRSHECLRLLLPHAHDLAASTALSATISIDDIEGTRLLLDAGVDPNRPLPADLFGDRYTEEQAIGTVGAAVEFASPDHARALVEAGADPNAPGRNGYPPYRLALRRGLPDLAEWLAAHGAVPDITDTDRLLAALLRGDRTEAQRLADVDVSAADQSLAFMRAAEAGDVEAVTLMLDLGFDMAVRDSEDGATPLHRAAYAGSADVVRLLIARGADVDVADARYSSPPLDWTIVGSGTHEREKPHSDFVATARALIEGGADLSGISWDEKPPSDEVAALLATYGVTP